MVSLLLEEESKLTGSNTTLKERENPYSPSACGVMITNYIRADLIDWGYIWECKSNWGRLRKVVSGDCR